MAAADEITIRKPTRNGQLQWELTDKSEVITAASGTGAGTAAELQSMAATIARKLGEETLAAAIEGLTVADITLSSALLGSSIKPAKARVPPNDPAYVVEVSLRPVAGSDVTERFTAFGPNGSAEAVQKSEAAKLAIAAWAYYQGATAFAVQINGL